MLKCILKALEMHETDATDPHFAVDIHDQLFPIKKESLDIDFMFN